MCLLFILFFYFKVPLPCPCGFVILVICSHNGLLLRKAEPDLTCGQDVLRVSVYVCASVCMNVCVCVYVYVCVCWMMQCQVKPGKPSHDNINCNINNIKARQGKAI